jgi:hypothetical protein
MALPLEGWRVVVTGDVPGMTRDAAKDAVRMMGGTSVSTVDARTDLLVVGPGAGASKLAKAAGLGLRLMPSAPFAELAENPDRWDGRPLGEVAPPPEPDGDAVPVGALAPGRDGSAGGVPDRPAAAHVAGTTSWTRAGTWTVVQTCRCGHRSEATSNGEAEAAHRAHRVAVGDLVEDGAG